MIALIIGGTGTLGQHVVPLLLQNPQIERVRILSRGEHRQMEMQDNFLSAEDRKRCDFFLGDCRDLHRMIQASKDCDMVFHFAAMKSVDKAEYDPEECVKTNIEGTRHVIRACIDNGVRRAIFTSTDKAVSPLNIYGASKLVAEKLFIQANIGRHHSRFSVCRYGNVLGSQGSVLEKWREAALLKKRISVTDERMTRFFIEPLDAAQFVVQCSYEMQGGEVFIPKMKCTRMWDLASVFASRYQDAPTVYVTGIRPGEKLHECLISEDEVSLVTDVGDKYIRWPSHTLFPVLKRGSPITLQGNSYTSENATPFTVEELKELIS